MLAQLRQAGKLKRAKAAEPDLVVELFLALGSSLACSACGQQGQQLTTVDPPADDDWGMAKRCARCRSPIPSERLELFPDTTLCVTCQQVAERESNDASGEWEFCRKCGGHLQVRLVSSSGLTRYVSICQDCGSRE